MSHLNDIEATIQAMSSQEDSSYICMDYINQLSENDMNHCGNYSGPLHIQDQVRSENAKRGCCREKMVDLCYQIADFCEFNRETVAIAMNYFDRFINTKIGSQALDDPRFFQLATMTALYTAVKIYEPIAMDPKIVSNLSQGTYTEEEVEHMEFDMLQALQWRVNPPTALAFIRQFLELIPSDDIEMKEAIYELTSFQTDLAVRDNKLLSVKNCTTALAAFMNALDSVCLERELVQSIAIHVAKVTNIDVCAEEFLNVQSTLFRNVSDRSCTDFADDSMYDTRMTDVSKNYDSFSSVEESPRSLAQHV